MNKHRIRILGIVIPLFLGFLEASDTFFPVDQIKAGMKGRGRSVFLGNTVEEFDVEILGVLKNEGSLGAKRNVILARLKSSRLEKEGVSQGMSGSPVYVEGKLVGAVAYSFPYSKEPIAGITPIGEMLAIENQEPPKASFNVSQPIRKHISLEELLEINKDILTVGYTTRYEGKDLSPLSIPLVFNGFSSLGFEKSKHLFSRLGFSPQIAGVSSQSSQRVSFLDSTLKAGDPVGIQLISGDLNLAATGTVTYVEGNKVFAFGHPVYNLGAVEYGMAKAEVITVVPSLSTSFKITATNTLLGRFSQDRSTGTFGELGKMPHLVPVQIKITDARERTNDIHIQVVEDKILTPFLLNTAISSILFSEERAVGDLSLELNGEIYLENGMSVHLEDFFSGNFDSSIKDLTSLVTSASYFLTSNEFKELGIHRIDLNIRSSEDIRISYLEKVWLNKYEASPGEAIELEIHTRNFRGEGTLQKGAIFAPSLPSGSEFYLAVADALSLQQLEGRQYRSRAFVPRSLSQLIRLLSSLRKNNRIYLKILAEKPGLFLKGEEMPNLPPTMKSMFSSSRAAVSTPIELTQSTLSYYQLPVPFVFKGATVIPVRIK